MKTSERMHAVAAMARRGIVPAPSWGPYADLLDQIADGVATYERLGAASPAACVPWGMQAALITTAALGFADPHELGAA